MADTNRWVDRCARVIQDPLCRLRFLKYAAKLPDPSSWKRKRRLASWRLPVLLTLASSSLVLMLARGRVEMHSAAGPVAASPVPAEAVSEYRPATLAAVWLVEKSGNSETYSNGLRIDNKYFTTTHERSYVAFRQGEGPHSEGVRRSQPAGIVYHTTESVQAAFEPGQNGALKRIGESTLAHVQRKGCYNFVVDRFGRVYRIVAEGHAAFHAGHSVWVDEEWVYINLNESFLAVSFETGTKPGQVEPGISAAQTRAAAMLTEMLRSRFSIPAANCVTHAQVSVNPSNMRVGYHTDWASSFPFAAVGLPNNYARPLAAITMFGFDFDGSFLRSTGRRMSEGVELAEENVRVRATTAALPLAAFRKQLQKSYWEKVAIFKDAGASEDEEPASRLR